MNSKKECAWSVIDGIGPFFLDLKKKRINWSKIPFANLEKEGVIDEGKWRRILAEFRTFCQKVSAIGFNTLTLDDIAHLVLREDYPTEIQKKILSYQKSYSELFAIAEEFHLSILITTDSFFRLQNTAKPVSVNYGKILGEVVDSLFQEFPELKGVVLRLGECDGLDVKEDFISELVLKNGKQAREYLEELLPVFEKHSKHLIVRTWTVGAYPIGDLIWNTETFQEVFEGLSSDSLVVSLKYGESDFFRYLPLNKHFFKTQLPTIVELQSRREYEGCGEFPAFIGKMYEEYHRELASAENLIGFSVWCQTGGWVKFRRRAFVDGDSFWTELNTYVTYKIFKEGKTSERALQEFHFKYALKGDWLDLLELMRLSEEVVHDLLYIDEFARKKLFFRRLRIPPLLTVYWDHILINQNLKNILNHFVEDKEHKVRQGFLALEKVKKMIACGKALELPWEDLEFMHDSFALMATARKYYFLPKHKEVQKELKELKTLYKAKWRGRARYAVKIDLKEGPLRQKHLGVFLKLLFRDKRGYRYLDHLVTLRLLGWIYPFIKIFSGKMVPGFAEKRAMGIDSLFK